MYTSRLNFFFLHTKLQFLTLFLRKIACRTFSKEKSETNSTSGVIGSKSKLDSNTFATFVGKFSYLYKS